MKRKVLALALSMGIVFGGAGQAFADENIDKKIEAAQSELTKAEEDYKKIKDAYYEFREYNKDYIDANGKYISDNQAVKDQLVKAAENLDKLVSNKTPSIEQAMLQAKFANGFKDENYNIRPLNAYDLLEFIKSDFDMKEGVNPKEYEQALVIYVNAISDYVIFPNLKEVSDSLYKEVKNQENKVKIARDELSSAKKIKNKDLIEKLEEAIYKAETNLNSAKDLIKIAPKTIAPVRSKLDKLISNQENTIKLAKQAIEKLS